MRARLTDEAHRAATPLELFFDLCFVVAVAQASASLHHALAADELAKAVGGYLSVFFAIWWAWMNFTWFASAYDTDDVAYRLAVFVQIAGVLILAAGVPRAFEERDFGVVTLGYVVMRVALVAQWLRAAAGDPERRRTDRRYALGVSVCMVGWIGLLLLPEGVRAWGFPVMVLAELTVPVYAERASPTTWHPHHIAERYGLFTLIVLGESVLAATLAVQSALDAGDATETLAEIALGGLLIVCSMWWLYFGHPTSRVVEHAREVFGVISREGFVWGYGHYLVFAAAAAVGAGIAVAVDQAFGDAALTRRGATATVTIPVVVYLVAVWALHVRLHANARAKGFVVLAGSLALLIVTMVGGGVLTIGVVLVGIVVALVVLGGDSSRVGTS
jgi:low temperature requirement protein LtrA